MCEDYIVLKEEGENTLLFLKSAYFFSHVYKKQQFVCILPVVYNKVCDFPKEIFNL